MLHYCRAILKEHHTVGGAILKEHHTVRGAVHWKQSEELHINTQGEQSKNRSKSEINKLGGARARFWTWGNAGQTMGSW